MSDGEGSIRCAQWKDAVGIDQLKSAREAASDAFIQGSVEETWEIVTDHHARPFGQVFHHAMPIPFLPFDIGVVMSGGFLEVVLVVDHSVNEELMKPVARPTVTDANCF